MTTRLEPLLTLEIQHDYYGGVCRDLGFVVPEDVARRIKGAGLLTKLVDGSLRVFYRADEGGAPVVSAAGITLRVGLAVQNASFANFTEGYDPGAGALHYRNHAAPGALDAPPTAVALVGRSFSRLLSRSERPVTVTFRDAAGLAVHVETVTAQNGRSSVGFDLSAAAPGLCELEEAYPGETVRSSHYVDPELLRAGVFGVVDLRIDGAFYAAPPTFRVNLRARTETLKYYLVAKGFTNGEVDQLTVQDWGFGEQNRPEVTFTRELPPFSDSDIPEVLLGGEGKRVLLFKSEAPVPRRERGRARIQLMRNDEALIQHLPQPGADRSTADLIIHLSKSKP